MAGVAGWPVAHSLSPRLHGYWLARYGIDGAYVPFAIPPERFEIAIRGLAASGLRGCNVTVPHKQAALGVCTELDAAARRAGAVNTLLFDQHGRIAGRNTDGRGFLSSLQAAGADGVPPGAQALILGAGGAARAIAAALLDAGWQVCVTSRNDAAAQALVIALEGARSVAWAERGALAGVRLLVNATSGGMSGQQALEMPLDAAEPGLIVADIVYAPRETALLAAARARGCLIVEGIDMLLFQAAEGFAAWFGVAPEVDEELRRHVLAGA